MISLSLAAMLFAACGGNSGDDIEDRVAALEGRGAPLLVTGIEVIGATYSIEYVNFVGTTSVWRIDTGGREGLIGTEVFNCWETAVIGERLPECAAAGGFGGRTLLEIFDLDEEQEPREPESERLLSTDDFEVSLDDYGGFSIETIGTVHSTADIPADVVVEIVYPEVFAAFRDQTTVFIQPGQTLRWSVFPLGQPEGCTVSVARAIAR